MIKSEMRQKLYDNLVVLQAAEILEYHDKNFLESPARTSRKKQEILNQCIDIVNRFSLDTEPDSADTPQPPKEAG